MEDFLWMLRQASIPMGIGSIMAFSLSFWSGWSSRTKLRLGAYYQLMILVGWFSEPVNGHPGWLDLIAAQLRGGVFGAFGVGIGMSMLRLSESWTHRSIAGIFSALNLVALGLTFKRELLTAIHRIVE